MSTPRIDDSVLQQLLDDELGTDERAEALRLLEGSTFDQGRVRALERLGEFVNDVTAEDAAQLSAAESGHMFANVLLGLEAALQAPAGEAATAAAATETAETAKEEDGRKRPKLRLIEGEGLGTLPPRSEKVAFEPKLTPEGLAEEKRASQPAQAPGDTGAKWPGLVAVVVLAAAAVLALALRPSDGPPAPIAQVVAPDAPVDPVVIDEEPEVIVASHRGTEVEEIDFGSNMGTVFQVPGERDVPVAVVWISDEEYVR